MQWAGLLTRRRFRTHPIAVSAARTTLVVLLALARDASTMPTMFLRDSGEENLTTEKEKNIANTTHVSHREVETNAMAIPQPVDENSIEINPFERMKTHRLPINPVRLPEDLQTDPTSPTELSCSNHLSASKKLLTMMAETQSPFLMWNAYLTAVERNMYIPPILLDRIMRVLIRKYAATRETFLRLHDVIIQYQKQGCIIRRWQWNALIYHSAVGLRKLQTSHYQSALDIYWQMISYRKSPGHERESTPDICTYTTLVYIAIRTRNHEHVSHALSLLTGSKLVPDRIARLAMIPFYTLTGNLRGVTNIVQQFNEKGEDIGIDGINAYIWAFGRLGHLKLLGDVYTALRANVKEIRLGEQGDSSKEENSGEVALPVSEDMENIVYNPFENAGTHELDDLPDKPELEPFPLPHTVYQGSLSPEGIARQPDLSQRTQIITDLVIRGHHIPDRITYTLCMQVFAYYGDIYHALKIFRDTITTPDSSQPGNERPTKHFPATQQAYRALFLGIVRKSREGNHFSSNLPLPPSDVESSPSSSDTEWLKDALDFVFESFLAIDTEQFRPNQVTLRWILEAFANLTQFDTETLIGVWHSLETKFGKLSVPRDYRNIIRVNR
ncbi:hypothetical protein FS842_003096 [Serendipita sp. 407]|nr:hypothetical protein FS842_003096 [Serendipita sp. 407]